MSYIIELLKSSKKNNKPIKVITQEGQQSYVTAGTVKELNDIDILLEKSNGGKVAIRISNIVKIED